MKCHKIFLICVLLFLSSCLVQPAPLQPEKALLYAENQINKLLVDSPSVPAIPRSTHADHTVSPDTISFWYAAHPLLAPGTFQMQAQEALASEYPDINLESQFIGEWPYAVQKLTVGLAVGDLPDVALVKRSWAAPLVFAGRVMPLNALLSAEILLDLCEPAKRFYEIDGLIYGLPADGFCTVWAYRADLIPGSKTPDTWARVLLLAEFIQHTQRNEFPIASVPFLELLWSYRGSVVRSGRASISEPETIRALAFLLILSNAGYIHHHTVFDMEHGFRLLRAGRAAMGAVSSRNAPSLLKSPLPFNVIPMPGDTENSFSSFSDDVLIVFTDRAETRRHAIAALLGFLTGPNIQGQHAVDKGSAPVRKSVADSVDTPEWLDTAYVYAKAPPLLPNWIQIEMELYDALQRTLRWSDKNR